MTVLCGTRSQLSSSAEAELASYRYEIFVDRLHWQLPAEVGREFDQFDRADTRYVIARDAHGRVCGCARLLPTTQAYLLDEVFPGLMNGQAAPHDVGVWELSRFSTRAPGELQAPSREEARTRFCCLFATVVETALTQGATRLITFTAMGVERILRRIGIHAHRVGPPQLIDDKPILALWIELDEQTCRSLGLAWESPNVLSH